MDTINILLVEDDKDIAELLTSYFTEAEYNVVVATDGAEALTIFNENNQFQVVLLDLMLPKKSGVEVLTAIRMTSYIPVIIISAKETDFDKSTLLELGADDYVTKPFSLLELHARVKAAIRRTTSYSVQDSKNEKKQKQFLDLVLDEDEYIVYKDGKNLQLTSTEYKILLLFMKYPTKVFAKEDIYQSVWKESYYGDENIVNVHMSRLRDKLGENKKDPKYIQTLWGIGYRLKVVNDKK